MTDIRNESPRDADAKEEVRFSAADANYSSKPTKSAAMYWVRHEEAAKTIEVFEIEILRDDGKVERGNLYRKHPGACNQAGDVWLVPRWTAESFITPHVSPEQALEMMGLEAKVLKEYSPAGKYLVTQQGDREYGREAGEERMTEGIKELVNPEALGKLTEKQVEIVKRLIRANNRIDMGLYEVKRAEIDPPKYTKQAFLIISLGLPEVEQGSSTRHYCIGPRGGLKTYNGRRWFSGWSHFHKYAHYN